MTVMMMMIMLRLIFSLCSRCDPQFGWGGDLCDQCQVTPGCLHGTCSSPWECNCQSHWGGLLCDSGEFCSSLPVYIFPNEKEVQLD